MGQLLVPNRRGRLVPFLEVAVATICGLMLLAGCRAKPSSDSSSARTFQIKGIVVSANPDKSEVTVDTKAIPGFMQPMIMPYHVADAKTVQHLRAGDQITARLRVVDRSDSLDQIAVVKHAQPVFRPPVVYNRPELGQQVPDFVFVNQDGRRIHLNQFHGQAVLLTFVYTRCPLPNYCVRMSRNFAQIHRSLAARPSLYAKTHLLTISFDPAHDTPEVLRRYGESYIGGHEPERAFAQWDFATPPKAELKKVEEFFDVAVRQGPDGTLTHSLSTVLINQHGKIVNWYPTNTWNPEVVLQALEKVAG